MPDLDTPASEREDHALLHPILSIADGTAAAAWMLVSGRWSLPNDTTATLATVLASREDAAAVLMTLLTKEQFFRSLPDDADEIARHFGRGGHTVRGSPPCKIPDVISISTIPMPRHRRCNARL